MQIVGTKDKFVFGLLLNHWTFFKFESIHYFDSTNEHAELLIFFQVKSDKRRQQLLYNNVQLFIFVGIMHVPKYEFFLKPPKFKEDGVWHIC